MLYYADSSFLISCYLPDANTAAKAWLMRSNVPLPFTALHALEVLNALRLGVFRGNLTPEQVEMVMSDLEADRSAGRLIRTPVRWPVAFRVATRLAATHTPAIGTRSLDILHVAAAKTLRMTGLLSFDIRQLALAKAAGLAAFPETQV